jgi:hypothetical protein
MRKDFSSSFTSLEGRMTYDGCRVDNDHRRALPVPVRASRALDRLNLEVLDLTEFDRLFARRHHPLESRRQTSY